MAKNYLHIPAIGQVDATLCWAACLSWWLKAVKNKRIDQTALRDRHYKLFSDDGTMSNNEITNLISNKRYGMTLDSFNSATNFTPTALREHLDYSPVYIAYTETSSQKKHVNVIWAMSGSGSNTRVAVMEPEFQPINDESGFPSGVFIGKHIAKNLSDFNSLGSVFVGSKMLSL